MVIGAATGTPNNPYVTAAVVVAFVIFAATIWSTRIRKRRAAGAIHPVMWGRGMWHQRPCTKSVLGSAYVP